MGENSGTCGVGRRKTTCSDRSGAIKPTDAGQTGNGASTTKCDCTEFPAPKSPRVHIPTRSRAVASIFAFIIAAGLIAHNNFADINQLNHFLKNLGLLGGCLALFVAGPGRYSIDRR